MRIAIMGGGAVGGYFGGLLSLAGNDVTFIARGEHLRAMQQHGLTLETPKGTDERGRDQNRCQGNQPPAMS